MEKGKQHLKMIRTYYENYDIHRGCNRFVKIINIVEYMTKKILNSKLRLKISQETKTNILISIFYSQYFLSDSNFLSTLHRTNNNKNRKIMLMQHFCVKQKLDRFILYEILPFITIGKKRWKFTAVAYLKELEITKIR